MQEELQHSICVTLAVDEIEVRKEDFEVSRKVREAIQQV